jgi:hypothetical protein
MNSRAWTIIVLALLLIPMIPGLADARDGGSSGRGSGSGQGYRGNRGHGGGYADRGGGGNRGGGGYRSGYSYRGGGGYRSGYGHRGGYGYGGGYPYRRGYHPGSWWYGPWGYPAYGYPYPYVYAYPYPSETRVIIEERQVYVERPQSTTQAPSPPQHGYWHYCESRGGYYPDVPTCPEDWVKVPPRPE